MSFLKVLLVRVLLFALAKGVLSCQYSTCIINSFLYDTITRWGSSAFTCTKCCLMRGTGTWILYRICTTILDVVPVGTAVRRSVSCKREVHKELLLSAFIGCIVVTVSCCVGTVIFCKILLRIANCPEARMNGGSMSLLISMFVHVQIYRSSCFGCEGGGQDEHPWVRILASVKPYC